MHACMYVCMYFKDGMPIKWSIYIGTLYMYLCIQYIGEVENRASICTEASTQGFLRGEMFIANKSIEEW